MDMCLMILSVYRIVLVRCPNFCLSDFIFVYLFFTLHSFMMFNTLTSHIFGSSCPYILQTKARVLAYCTNLMC